MTLVLLMAGIDGWPSKCLDNIGVHLRWGIGILVWFQDFWILFMIPVVAFIFCHTFVFSMSIFLFNVDIC